MTGYIYFSFYLIIINLVSALLTAWDKQSARLHRWRVPEKTLFLFAALGGSPAMLLTMLLIRHKTRHVKFMLGLPFLLILQAGAAFLFHYWSQ